MHLSWSVFVGKIHLQVPVDEFALTKTNHLHAETQTRASLKRLNDAVATVSLKRNMC